MNHILFLLVSFSLFAFDVIEEEYQISSPSEQQIKLVMSNPDLIVDHVDEHGFEIYGPAGLGLWLSLHQFSYQPLGLLEQKDIYGYPSYNEITQRINELAQTYPHLIQLESIGQSVEGRELWMVKMSNRPDVDLLRPEFKYISSMHGNEITGRELCLNFIEYLASNYTNNNDVRRLLDNAEVFILPSMNPDGSERRIRANANRRDLNRNFPDWTRNQPNTTRGREPETVAVMEWHNERNFALSANFHGGALVANYPWDSDHARHPLNNLLMDISRVYATHNTPMANSSQFQYGITNGADWYVLKGGMQDWSYIHYNDLQITLEVSNIKWPDYEDIPQFWQENKDSMLEYSLLIFQGQGFRLNTNRDVSVEIFKETGESMGTTTVRNQEFYKILPEGNYNAHFTSGNQTQQFNFSVDKNTITPYIDVTF